MNAAKQNQPSEPERRDAPRRQDECAEPRRERQPEPLDEKSLDDVMRDCPL